MSESNLGNPSTNPSAKRFEELGVAGVNIQGGVVHEEWLPELRGYRGRLVLRRMSEQDSTIAAFLHAIETIVRGVEWRVEPGDDSPEAEEGAEFAESLMGDMSHTWDEFISEALSMLIYGWSFHEIVLKRRNGPTAKDSNKRSKYNDGLIGIRKLAPRAQRSLDRWDVDDNGGIQGLYQWNLYGTGAHVYIPIDRGLLFRTKINGNNPEGQSILRRAYKDWYYKTEIEMTEAIGIEREMAGMPVARVPNDVLTNPERAKEREAYQKMVRDLRYNEQGGVVLPSETYRDESGNPTSTPLVDLQLMSSSGQRAIDTDTVIKRYDQRIARAVLADFLILGTEHGSFALSKSKTDLFLQSLESYLTQIRDTLNRHLLPRIWRYNGFRSEVPAFQYGRVAPVDLEELGTYLRNLAGAGIPLGPDEDLESELRNAAGLPQAAPEE